MNKHSIPGSLPELLRRQILYLGVAAAVYAVFWAIGQTVNLRAALIYSICLGNFAGILLQQVWLFSGQKKVQQLTVEYLALLLLLTPVMVPSATVVVFWVDQSAGGGHFRFESFRSSYWSFLQSGWRFPAVATLIFGSVILIHRITRQSLERANRELLASVNLGSAQRDLQEQELQRALEIQQGLLPKTIPQIPGFEIAGAWEPARTVSGDYFDIIDLGQNKLAVCIADVAGKGLAAALLMANVQAVVRAYATESASPSWLCCQVNAALCENLAAGKFVTLFYGVLDGKLSTFRYCNAGHLPPILLAASGAVRPLDDNGALLGVFPAWKYLESTVKLSPGDRLLLFTDGITEAMHPNGEEFGEQRLIAAARGLAELSSTPLKDRLLGAVKEFCQAQLADDATLIVVNALAPRNGQNSAEGGHVTLGFRSTETDPQVKVRGAA